MTELKDQTCEACRVGAPSLSPAEIEAALTEIPAWQAQSEADVPRLVRRFEFKNFAAAMAFANRVGELAETQNHHPKLVVEWGKVEVSWWTHKIGGVHQNDVIMAAKTDSLY